MVPPLWEVEGRPGPEEPGQVDSIERSIAYLVDFEGRVTKHLGPSSPFVTISTTAQRLGTAEGRSELSRWLGVETGDGGRATPPRTNVRGGWKAFYGAGSRESEEELRSRLADYLARAVAAGLDLPEILRSW